MTAPRYDGTTIIFHWLTALLVFAIFGTALAWGYLPRGMVSAEGLQSLHISLGISLAAVLVGRMLWRLTRGRRLPHAESRIDSLISRVVHFALYGLLAAQVALGFSLRWLQGERFAFFNFFTIPSPLIANEALADTIENLHNLVGWTLIVLALGHAAMALLHHYVLKDHILRRMLPGRVATDPAAGLS